MPPHHLISKPLGGCHVTTNGIDVLEGVLQAQGYLPQLTHHHHPFRHCQNLDGGIPRRRGRFIVLQAWPWAFLMKLIAASSMKTGLLISTNQSSNNFGCRMTLFVGYCLMGLGQNITGWISVSVSGVGLGSYTVEWTWCKGKVCRGSGLGLSETRPSGLIDAAALTKEIYSLIHTNHSSNAWSFKTASGVRNRFIGLGQKKLCIPGADGWGGSNSGGWNGKSRRGSGLFDSLDSSSCASSSYSAGSKWWRGESRHGSGLSASTWWNSIFLLMGNDKRLPPPHYRNAETLGPMGKLDDRLFCEYFARLPNKGLRNRGYTRVVRGDNRTTQQKVSGSRHS